MYPLFETIKIQNCKIQNSDLHLERVFNSRYKIWKVKYTFDFEKIFSEIESKLSIEYSAEIIYKLKVIYNQSDLEYEINDYSKPIINHIKLINDDFIDYQFKFTDRNSLELLKMAAFRVMSERAHSEIIIIKNGMATDSSFSNLVFSKDDELITPANFLLRGTKMEKYIREKIILEKPVRAKDIMNFDSIHFINAMNDLGDLQYFLH